MSTVTIYHNPDCGTSRNTLATIAHPVLVNRPFVVTLLGVRLCRPSEVVLDILPEAQRAAFTKEDGEVVIDAEGKRVHPAK